MCSISQSYLPSLIRSPLLRSSIHQPTSKVCFSTPWTQSNNSDKTGTITSRSPITLILCIQDGLLTKWSSTKSTTLVKSLAFSVKAVTLLILFTWTSCLLSVTRQSEFKKLSTKESMQLRRQWSCMTQKVMNRVKQTRSSSSVNKLSLILASFQHFWIVSFKISLLWQKM